MGAISKYWPNSKPSYTSCLLFMIQFLASYIAQCSKWVQVLLNVILTEYNRITWNRNGHLSFIGHKRMFTLKVLISVLLLDVLIYFLKEWPASGGGGGGQGLYLGSRLDIKQGGMEL